MPSMRGHSPTGLRIFGLVNKVQGGRSPICPSIFCLVKKVRSLTGATRRGFCWRQ